jgi:hypothetical protein
MKVKCPSLDGIAMLMSLTPWLGLLPPVARKKSAMLGREEAVSLPSGALERQPSVYVYFTSGEVVTVSPASSVAVQPDRVIVYDGVEPVASYRRSEVFSCSRTEESPAFT